MRKILQKEDPIEDKILRKKAREVAIFEIMGAPIQQLIKEMRSVLDNEIDGVGLAAPQIGESLRIFIVSNLVYNKVADAKEKKGKNIGQEKQQKNLVFINPEFVKISREKHILEEGCLSIRPWYGNVKRAKKVIIKAYDENGKHFERGASGLLAQIFQHEMDHLEGTLFTDKAKNIHQLPIGDQDE
jgi:peptide deformylase